MVSRLILGVFVSITILAFVPTTQAATNLFGIRLGVYTDIEDLFVGMEALSPLSSDVYFNPNLEYIFIDYATFMTFNFDLHYDFPTRTRDLSLWAGAGLGILYRDPEGPRGGNADVGANILMGVAFGHRPAIPYIQSKLILADDAELAISFGLRF